jgi:hypothetical protein
MRFKNTSYQSEAIASYLIAFAEEADRRGYNFNKSKIIDIIFREKFPLQMSKRNMNSTQNPQLGDV